MDASTIRLTFGEFENLPEQEGRLYELDEGRLMVTPSPTVQHNRIRDRIARRLSEFVENRNLGEVMIEVDFRLGPDTVRNPDVAFVGIDHLRRIDVERSPAEGAPILAVEVISPANSAQDTVKKSTNIYVRDAHRFGLSILLCGSLKFIPEPASARLKNRKLSAMRSCSPA